MSTRPKAGQAKEQTPEAVALAARRAKALALRIEGKSYAAIAADLGVSVGSAHSDVHSELNVMAAERAELAEQVRAIELARIDFVVETATKAATGGDVKALGVLLKATETRARLLGLDAPKKVEITANADDALAKLRAIVDGDG